jgi:hypothetical protein
MSSLRNSTNATRGYQQGSWNAGAKKHSECERGAPAKAQAQTALKSDPFAPPRGHDSAFQGGGEGGEAVGGLVPVRVRARWLPAQARRLLVPAHGTENCKQSSCCCAVAR